MAAELSAVRMTADKITVVIAVKDGMPFVSEAVRSALAQGDAVACVVVVDDGSTDGTRAAIEAIADPRVSVMANPGCGVSSARNAGAALASTRWLLFLDADDRLVDRAAARLLATAAQQPAAIAVYGDHARIDERGERIGRGFLAGARRLLIRARRKPSGAILGALVRGNFIINGGVIAVTRDAFAKAGGFDPALSLCEDWHLWCRLAALGPIVYTTELVMDYRVHMTSVMMGRRRRFEDFKPALDAIYRNRLVLSNMQAAELATARPQAEVDLMSYCAVQACRTGAKASGLAMALAAARHYPAKAPWVMLRFGVAMAGH